MSRGPCSTPPQRALGVRLYNTLGCCATSYRDWFAEGLPHEWVQALHAIQTVLTQCKRDAAACAQAAHTARGARETLPLFPTREDTP